MDRWAGRWMDRWMDEKNEWINIFSGDWYGGLDFCFKILGEVDGVF